MSRTLSRWFTVQEFHCHDGRHVPKYAEEALDVLVAAFLDKMRERFGRCHVLSGYRPADYNKLIGGAPDSRHIYSKVSPKSSVQVLARGVAADVQFVAGDVEQWHRHAAQIRDRSPYLRQRGKGGIGVYPSSHFVHLDTGPRRDWRG